MDDLIGEFGIASLPQPVVAAKERSSVWSLARWLPRAFWRIRKQLAEIRGDSEGYDVLIHGDTLSTLLGALAGRTCGGRVLHLESGLTSGHLFDPFPEELCRRLVFRLSDVAFCPSREAAEHMRTHYRCEVVDTRGNTVADAVRLSGVLDSGREPVRPRLVVSIHRFQNIFDASRITAIVELVRQLANHFDVHFVLHPATRKRLEATRMLGGLQQCPGIHLSPRLGYREFISLAASASCVLTDGGSNQEELAVLGVPTIVMRERTERADGLGRNAIMEADIAGGVLRFLLDGNHEHLRTPVLQPADPGPSVRIAEYLEAGPEAQSGLERGRPAVP
jgi:UDP-N-acetylglucosamine 2-epimerase (non-hydrolysing)